MKNKKVLIVAAHPDDEVLGCGGTIAKMVNEGHEVYSLILSQGVSARFDNKQKKPYKEFSIIKKEAVKANEILGVKKIYFLDFPDNKLDTIPMLDIIKKIEKIKNDIKPEVIFTHFYNDLNIDHRITYNACITATRPFQPESVMEIYSFETLSSTEWKFPLTFSPNIYFDISGFLKLKIKAIKAYNSELREYPHPRSEQGIEINASYWGMRVGCRFAEAFQTVRIIQ